jgi:hypothetical protein
MSSERRDEAKVSTFQGRGRAKCVEERPPRLGGLFFLTVFSGRARFRSRAWLRPSPRPCCQLYPTLSRFRSLPTISKSRVYALDDSVFNAAMFHAMHRAKERVWYQSPVSECLRAAGKMASSAPHGLSGQAINLRAKRARSRLTFGCIRTRSGEVWRLLN